jgi:hypothetical protein
MIAVSALSAMALVGIVMAPPLVGFQREIPLISDESAPPVSYVIPASYVPEAVKPGTQEIVKHPESVIAPKRLKQKPETVRVLASVNLSEGPAPTEISAPQTQPGQTVLVVMHTEQYDRFGGAMWTICVWRLDLPAQNAVGQKTIPAKQI